MNYESRRFGDDMLVEDNGFYGLCGTYNLTCDILE
jgi:hypothetical protein